MPVGSSSTLDLLQSNVRCLAIDSPIYNAQLSTPNSPLSVPNLRSAFVIALWP